MFIKLVKNEFKASYRSYLPIYLVLILSSFFISLTMKTENLLIVGILAMMGFFIGILVVYVLTFVNMIKSVGTRVYGKEGYLLFTIPTTTQNIMLSKILVNFLWYLATILVTILSLLIIFYSPETVQAVKDALKTTEIQDLIKQYTDNWHLSALNALLSLLFFNLLIMSIFSFLYIYYKKEYKVLIGLIMFFVVNYIQSSIQTKITETMDLQSQLIFQIIYSLLLSVLLFLFNFYSIEKKLEIE